MTVYYEGGGILDVVLGRLYDHVLQLLFLCADCSSIGPDQPSC